MKPDFCSRPSKEFLEQFLKYKFLGVFRILQELLNCHSITKENKKNSGRVVFRGKKSNKNTEISLLTF
jgi:hypothetical protein